MKNYHKIFFSVFIGFFALVVGLLVYGSKTSDSISEISWRLKTVTLDSLKQIIIAPMNPDWKINLTLDTIYVVDENEMQEIIGLLNTIDEDYPGRGLRKTWEAKMILDYKESKDIVLDVVDSFEGVCLFYTNTMGNPKYKCDGLKRIFEHLATYKEPVGNRD
jgi:hypothetical protein